MNTKIMSHSDCSTWTSREDSSDNEAIQEIESRLPKNEQQGGGLVGTAYRQVPHT